ncbi:HEAT repeat domain-containing protein [Halalkalibacter alkaliphilus]|uniref:HEAT repeat domain-containing protein n=1 Tax=Halalkalibacter alkaliphilus TaxID=2917993 RepID=A0A9X1ZUC2_9BACI|nr:HEAT repeat domain-containing protein [Halalkalibacter alkaliphilus]MCL7745659.1 HEAT repeat domain-containing protein [Halalkalibacter alkaliphilus]
MGYYDLSKEERVHVYKTMEGNITFDVKQNKIDYLLQYAADQDTYIRKNAYLIMGRLYHSNPPLQEAVLQIAEKLLAHDDEKIRQTIVNALGEIGKKDASSVMAFFEKALFDEHHSVRNAVIGSFKKMGKVNPKPVLSISKKYLHHPDPEIRREVIHGIELRGRTHPEEVLPLLKEVQFETVKRVRNMIIHVIGQISYKEGCLEKVVQALREWENKELVQGAIIEIIDVHHRYMDFSDKTAEEAKIYISRHL